jgi:squalene/oxidosqualene cyclase-like protein
VSDENNEEVVFNAEKNPNSSDLLLRNYLLSIWNGPRPDVKSKPKTAKQAAHKAMSFYQMIQTSDGHWAGDYGGPMFLMPGLICTLYLTKVPFPEGRKEGMVVYLKNHQQVDGGWGTHIENASTMFGTVLSYVALRLLGEPPEAEHMRRGLAFIHQHGGALYAPSWAKFWMAVIGVYHWDGINSIPAEMFLLPSWFPLHPGKLWCHCRMVYLPMCYLYCKRYLPADVDSDPVLQGLRFELFDCGVTRGVRYADIDWNAYRQTCAPIDEYSPLNPVMKVAQDFLAVYERFLPHIPFLRNLRKKALKFVIEYIHAEDFQTNYIDIGPVNKALNMLSVFESCGYDSDSFQRHIARVDDYIWVAEDGVKMQGYNGSQCWDTSFTVRAMVEGGLATEFPECSRKIYSYLDRTQIKENEENRHRYYRHESKGGWPFSTAAHGWPISDCTSEGLKGVLALHSAKLIPLADQISDRRLCDACDVLLSYHNEDGGWATYENNRGYRWYEMLNPSEVFGDIMIDYSYVECSSATITALKDFSDALPGYRASEVQNAIQAGRAFLKTIQRPDGSWYGSWGNCFTYGTWFGIEGLVSAGESLDSDNVRRAVAFLLSKQNRNGGWGESYLACINKAYPAEGAGELLGDGGSGVVQTAWALLGLLAGGCTDETALRRGRDFLMHKQLPSGDWAQEGITGVFNRSCGITYTAYRNLFPMWALARYATRFEEEDK